MLGAEFIPVRLRRDHRFLCFAGDDLSTTLFVRTCERCDNLT
jgi:hypothetical protein